MRDPHRPGHQPAQGIYDALVKFTPNRPRGTRSAKSAHGAHNTLTALGR